MRILIDINGILDIVQKREPFQKKCQIAAIPSGLHIV